MGLYYANTPHDVLGALTNFSLDFATAFALGDVEQWTSQIGNVLVSDAIKTTIPIPLSTAGYQLRSGDDKLRRLYARTLSVSPVEWVDGVEEKAYIIKQVGQFIGWTEEPAAMALEAVRHPNVLVADMLRSNPLLDFYRYELPGGTTASTLHLFDSSHPYNALDASFGTFDNAWSAGDTVGGETVPAHFNQVLARQLSNHFRSILGPNGRPMGLRFGGLLVTNSRAEEARDAFQRDVVLEALRNVAGTENVAGGVMPNRFGGVQILEADELTGLLPSGSTGDGDTVYAFATKPGGLTPPPWIVQRTAAPEEIVYDESSDHYRDTGMVGVKEVLRMSASAALPQAIVRINLTP